MYAGVGAGAGLGANVSQVSTISAEFPDGEMGEEYRDEYYYEPNVCWDFLADLIAYFEARPKLRQGVYLGLIMAAGIIFFSQYVKHNVA